MVPPPKLTILTYIDNYPRPRRQDNQTLRHRHCARADTGHQCSGNEVRDTKWQLEVRRTKYRDTDRHHGLALTTARVLIRSILTVGQSVAFLRFFHTAPGAADKLLAVVKAAVPLISPIPALETAVTLHPAASVLALDLQGAAGDGTIELVLSKPTVRDSVTDGGWRKTERVRALKFVSITRTALLITPVLPESNKFSATAIVLNFYLAVNRPVT